MTNDYFSTYTPASRNTLARAETLNAIADGIVAGFDLLPSKAALKENRVTYAADSGAANAYVVALDASIVAYTAGLTITMKAANTNTLASTVNVNGIGVKAILRYNGTTLAPGDIIAGAVVQMVYDGSSFRLVSLNAASSSNATSFIDSLFRVYNASDTTKQVALDISGVTTATTRTITVPDASGTLVLTAATQTLTNKTLSGPTVSGTIAGTATFSGALSAASLAPTSSSVPTNGFYLPTANSIGFANNSIATGTYDAMGLTLNPQTLAGAPANVATNALHLIGNAANNRIIAMDAAASNSAINASRYNGTFAVPTTLNVNNPIFAFNAAGYDGAAISASSAQFTFTASEGWTNTAHGTRITFAVTANTTVARVTTLTLENNGVMQQNIAFTVATLPAAGNRGSRTFITDGAAVPVFGALVAGGGALVLPVFDDGTNWRNG